MSEQDPSTSRRSQRRSKENAEPAAPVGDLGEVDAGSTSSGKEILDRNQRVRELAARKRDAARQTGGRAGRAGAKASKATGLDTSEMVDDALTRGTHATVGWARKHFNIVQWLLVGGLAFAIGAHLYGYRQESQVEQASDVLGKALHLGNARIGDTEQRGPDKNTGLLDVQPSFAAEDARLKALAAAYEQSKVQTGSQGLPILAQMGLAGVAFQRQKFQEAARLYSEVKASEFAGRDSDLKGRALVGISQSREALKDVEGALKPLRELENLGVPSFTPVAQYHQARLLYAQGKSDLAKPLLEKAIKKLEADKQPLDSASELESSVRSLLVLIDPTRAEAPGANYSPEQIRRIQEQIAELQKNAGALPSPPPSPTPSPSPPEK